MGRGRKPLGDVALTNAQKQARHRAKVKAELRGYRGSQLSPEGIAQARFLEYVNKKLAGEHDTTAWEFWTWLLEKAKGHKLDFSGYADLAFQRDRATAKDWALKAKAHTP